MARPPQSKSRSTRPGQDRRGPGPRRPAGGADAPRREAPARGGPRSGPRGDEARTWGPRTGSPRRDTEGAEAPRPRRDAGERGGERREPRGGGAGGERREARGGAEGERREPRGGTGGGARRDTRGGTGGARRGGAGGERRGGAGGERRGGPRGERRSDARGGGTQRGPAPLGRDDARRDGTRREAAAPGAAPRKATGRPVREDLVLQACLEAYGAVRHEGRLADRALDFTLRHKRNLYSNERRAVAERVYALLRRQRAVDFMLERARPRFASLDPTRQDVLRLATSRVLHGEQPFEVARGLSLSGDDAAALDALPEAAAALEDLAPARRFALSASLPDWLAERFRRTFGDKAADAAEAMNERAPLTARVNLLKTTREALVARLAEEGVQATPTPLSPFGLFLETRENAYALPSFREGLFELQDEGSQLLGMLVDAPPTRVVDACAGAGGKTLQLAVQMKNRGDLHALDVDARRMEDLKKRTRRAGVHNVRAQLIPADGPEAEEALLPLRDKADRVLVDAPCTGTGTFRRNPDARYRLTPEMLEEHVARQKVLLARFAALVKPGGRLVYGTCSVLREENEDVVEHFLAARPDFSVRPVTEDLGAELGGRTAAGPFLRLAPHLHGTDGFFCAVLVRAKA